MNDPVQKLKATLETSAKSKWGLPIHTQRLEVLNSLFGVTGNGDQIDYIPRAFLEEHEVESELDLDAEDGVLSWDRLHILIHHKEDWAARPRVLSDIQQWRRSKGQEFTPWFGTLDYMATGEGRTRILTVRQAYDEADFLLDIIKQHGDYYAVGFDLSSTLPTNSVVDFLLTPAMLVALERDARDGMVQIDLSHHVNFS